VASARTRPWTGSSRDSPADLTRSIFERFTHPARQVVVLAQEEARILRHPYIGPEHILLGLLREEHGVAARVLNGLDVTGDTVRTQVRRIVGAGEEITSRAMPFTPEALRALQTALREALSLDRREIGTEHLLLALVGGEETVATRVLAALDVHGDRVREVIYLETALEHAPGALRAVREELKSASRGSPNP
jgi:ATP-dependent Clp protease ATP-binding subunit ClpC